MILSCCQGAHIRINLCVITPSEIKSYTLTHSLSHTHLHPLTHTHTTGQNNKHYSFLAFRNAETLLEDTCNSSGIYYCLGYLNPWIMNVNTQFCHDLVMNSDCFELLLQFGQPKRCQNRNIFCHQLVHHFPVVRFPCLVGYNLPLVSRNCLKCDGLYLAIEHMKDSVWN